MEKGIFWTILSTLFGGIALIQNHLSPRQKAKEAQDERRFNAESSMSGVLSSVLRTLQWYVEIPASPGPKLERNSMDQTDSAALAGVEGSLEAFNAELERNSIELDERDLLVCKSFREQAEECRKFRRLAQVQRQDWCIAMEGVRKHPSDPGPDHLINVAEWHGYMAEDYTQQAKNYLDAAKVEADVLLDRWRNRRNSIGRR